MPVFVYKALQTNGTMAEGQLEAGGRQEAFRQIESRGLRPVRVTERGAAPPANRTQPRPNQEADRSKSAASNAPAPASFGWLQTHLASDAGELHQVIVQSASAGVPLSRALVILTKEAATPVAKTKWKEIHDLVIDGMSLADAMAKSPETFPRVYVAMVEAGETGGFLDVVLGQIADFQAREKEMRSKVMTALLYPLILLILALGV
jgi:type II secretory pathway component PulF